MARGHKRPPQSEQRGIFIGAKNRSHFCDATSSYQRRLLHIMTPCLARTCEEVLEAQRLRLERLKQRLKLWMRERQRRKHGRANTTPARALTYAALSSERLAVSKNVLAPLTGAAVPSSAASRRAVGASTPAVARWLLESARSAADADPRPS